MSGKMLNLGNIAKKMESNGLNQSMVARKIGVSREAVSKWLKKEAFPRPDKLLKLSIALGLKFDDIVERDNSNEPVVVCIALGSSDKKYAASARRYLKRNA